MDIANTRRSRGKQRWLVLDNLTRWGWHYAGIRQLIARWHHRLSVDEMQETFKRLAPAFGQASLMATEQVPFRLRECTGQSWDLVTSRAQLAFLSELMAALAELHDPANAAGWMVKLGGRFYPGKTVPRYTLATYDLLVERIQAFGGPVFTTSALSKAAKRLGFS